MRLRTDFYKSPATELAPLILGKLLCRRLDGNIIKRRITETECYYGETDTACHAHRGKTNRTKILYEKGGMTYVYLCYGIHNLLNIVTGREGHPEAVLIRGIDGYSGPGRLTKALQIDRTLNGADLTESDEIWLEDDGFIAKYVTTPRIGIGYADEKDRNVKWRFVSENVST